MPTRGTSKAKAPGSSPASPHRDSPFAAGYGDGAPLTSTTLDWVGDARPDWLRARFLQNGPGLFSVGDQRFNHWFDGLALLKSFDIGDDVVATARFLNSPDYDAAATTGKLGYTQFATVPDRNIWQRLVATLPRYEFGKNAAINFQTLTDGSTALPASSSDGGGDRAVEVLAIGDLPGGLRIDPVTLETEGVEGLRTWTMLTSTPHPQWDERRREWINVGLGISWRGVGYNIFGLAGRTMRPRHIAFIPRRRPAYMHSVATSDRYVVVAEHPILVGLFDMMTLGLRNRPLIDAMSWHGDEPMTLFVVDKDDGAVVARVETESRLYFHHANAFEQGDEVVVDLCTYPNADILDDLYLDRLRTAGGTTESATLTRYRIPVGATPVGGGHTGSVVGESLCDVSVEFPKINRANEHRGYRYTYAVSFEPGTPTGQANQLVKVDVTNGDVATWYEPGVYPTEPFMVARPGAGDEDDGVLLSVLLDVNTGRSALGVFDAASMTEIGRAVMPTAIPFGFHGQLVEPGA